MTGNHAGSAIACAILTIAAFAQTQPAGSRSQISGTVTNAGTSIPQLSLKSDQGADVAITITDRTIILRIPPGQHCYIFRPSDKTASLRYSLDSPLFADARPSTFAEIKTGDQMRVLG